MKNFLILILSLQVADILTQASDLHSPTKDHFPWLNTEYVEKIISKYEGHGLIKLNNYNVSAGSEKGQNFVGIILRVRTTYTINNCRTRNVNFIVKTSPKNEYMIDAFNFFEREAYAYEKTFKDVKVILPDSNLVPQLIHNDENSLVLEDLTMINYKVANRYQRLNFNEAKLVIEKLAKIHAATAFLNFIDPSSMSAFKSSEFENEETPLTFFLSESMRATLNTIRNTSDLAKYYPLLKNYDIIAKERQVFTRDKSDKFNALNHGDLWLSNIFFKYDKESTPVESLIIDFQESWFGSIGLDLNHFLYTSCDFDVHSNHFDELIEFYHQILTKTLKQLKHPKIPSLDDIRYEMKSKGDQALIVLCSMVPIQIIENPEHADPEYFLSDDEESEAIKREIYGNPKFIEMLKFFLPRIIERGIIG